MSDCKHTLRTFVALMLAVVVATSCTNNQRRSGCCLIVGTVDNGFNGDTVIIENAATRANQSTIISRNTFKFEVELSDDILHFISVIHNGNYANGASVVIEDTTVYVRISDQLPNNYKVVGGALNSLWTSLDMGGAEFVDSINRKFIELQDPNITDAQRDSLQLLLNNWFGKYHEYKKQFIIKHIPSLMSDALAGLYAPEFETSELDSLLNVLGERQPQYPAYKRLIALAIGHQFIDFTAPDTIGNSIKASDIVNKNKCTLIDFWASWCRPCREEMPYLLDAYAKYHGRGFEIIGVSLDAKRNQWVNAINSMQLPWINVCDSATYNSSVAINYCINAIPYNYLIDDEGKIVAKNLRGDALSIALSNIFK